jgi:hypothetical protein
VDAHALPNNYLQPKAAAARFGFVNAAIFPPLWLGFYMPFIVGNILLAIVFGSIWMWGLFKCLQNPTLTRGRKMAWALFILVFNFMGACLYLAYHVDSDTPTPEDHPVLR